MAHSVLLCATLIIAAIWNAAAYRRYLNYAPNSDKVPCATINGVIAEGCHGASVCEAWGHQGCLAKGTDDGIATLAGLSLQSAIEAGGWNVETCAADNDNDGKTDGDELGDGCCAWPAFPPQFTTGISNPSFESSTTTRASCTLSGAPPTPAGVAITSCGDGCASISWSVPAATSACVCEWALSVTVGAAQPVTIGTRSMPFVYCGQPSSTTITATVKASNRGGASSASTIASGVTGATGTARDAGVSCSATHGVGFFIDAAGSGSVAAASIPSAPNPSAGVYWLIGIGITFAIVGCVATLLPDPINDIRKSLVHRYLFVPLPDRHKQGQLWCKALQLYDLGEASIGYSLAILTVVIAMIACTFSTASYYEWMVFPLGTKAAVGRGAGYALAASMGLQLLPAARNSIWLPIFGVSFERALKLHRWAGWVTFWLAMLHALLMFIAYADSPLKMDFIFLWLPSDAVNPLAGFLAGLCIVVLTLLALDPVRRKAYELFLAGHALWPVAFVLAYLHIAESDTSLAPFFVFPLVMCGLDFFLLYADMFWLRESVLVDAGLMYGDGRVISCSTAQVGTAVPTSEPVAAFLVIDKLPAAFGWHFDYRPGQFVNIALPHISVFPHPITISSVADPAFPGRFTLHIRTMGPHTWSGKVVESVKRALSARMLAGGSHSQTAYAQPARRGAAVVEWALPGSGSNLPLPVAQSSAVDISNLPIDATLQRLFTVKIAGPFGYPSVQLQRYQHFVLVAGGIGITPIAPLHYSLVSNLSVAEPPSTIARLFQWMAGGCTDPKSSARRRAGRRRNRFAPLSGGIGGSDGDSEDVADVKTLTTVWAVREPGILSAFAPLLKLPAASVELAGGDIDAITGMKSFGAATPWASGFSEAPNEPATMNGVADSEGQVTAIARAILPASPAPFTPVRSSPAAPSTPLPTQMMAQQHAASEMSVDLQVYYTRQSQRQLAPAGAGPSGTGNASAGVDAASGPAARSAPTSTASAVTGPQHDLPWPTLTGRPDMLKILKKAADSAADKANASGYGRDKRLGSVVPVAVVVCGPQAMVESVLSTAAFLDGYSPPSHPSLVFTFHVHRETFLM